MSLVVVLWWRLRLVARRYIGLLWVCLFGLLVASLADLCLCRFSGCLVLLVRVLFVWLLFALVCGFLACVWVGMYYLICCGLYVVCVFIGFG